jgi:ABC-type multidrug transport system permease subunit
MQAFGIASILTCVFTMFAVYLGYQILSGILFGFSLIFMILSLLLSFQETLISVSALKLELSKTEGLGDE